MNSAYLCVLLASFMPMGLAGLAKVGGLKAGVAYDNAAPRASLARLSGWPQRANWAQQNTWEAFPVFAAAVLMALQAGVSAASVAPWAWAFLALRVAYAACYILDFATARSLFWLAAFGVCVRLMAAAI